MNAEKRDGLIGIGTAKHRNKWRFLFDASCGTGPIMANSIGQLLDSIIFLIRNNQTNRQSG